MSNQQQYNQPNIGSTFPAGSAQNEPTLGAKLDSAINQASQKFSSQQEQFENLSQKHPIWTEASQQGSAVREGFATPVTQPICQENIPASKIGEPLGAYSTSSTYPASTAGTSGLSYESYSTSATYPASYTTSTYPATTGYTETQKPIEQPGVTVEEESKATVEEHKHEHKSTTEKIKEKVHHAAEKIKEAFT